MNGFVQYSLPGQTLQSTILITAETSAKTYAKNFASYNTAGGVSSLTLEDADIQFGFTDASNKYTPAPTYTGFPNTVKVTMRLDSSANGSLKLFFAPIFGLKFVQRPGDRRGDDLHGQHDQLHAGIRRRHSSDDPRCQRLEQLFTDWPVQRRHDARRCQRCAANANLSQSEHRSGQFWDAESQ